MSHETDLKERIRNAPHMSKPDEAALVFYDSTGRWIFEMYCPAGFIETDLPLFIHRREKDG